MVSVHQRMRAVLAAEGDTILGMWFNVVADHLTTNNQYCTYKIKEDNHFFMYAIERKTLKQCNCSKTFDATKSETVIVSLKTES